MGRLARALRAEDAYQLAYLAATAVMILAGWNSLPDSGLRLSTTAAWAVLVLLVVVAPDLRPSKIARLVRDFYHLPLLLWHYEQAAVLDDVLWRGRMFDDVIAGWDARIFGFQPSVRFAEVAPWPAFSEVMHAGYLFYYLLIVGGALRLWLRNDDGVVFRRTLHDLVATMLLCYAAFVVFPVMGPQYYWPELAHQPLAGFVAKPLLELVLVLEVPGGAFPSTHVAVAVGFLFVFHRHDPMAFRVALAPSLVLVVSTVYLRAHYAIDVVAGLAVGAIVPLLVHPASARVRRVLALLGARSRPILGAFWTVPNALSISRVPLAVVAISCAAGGATTIAVLVLCLSFLTDAADGLVARMTHTESEWGRILDPIADKLAFLVVTAALVASERVPAWLLAAMLVRELVLVVGGIAVAQHVDRVPVSSIPGKLASLVLALYLVRQMFWPAGRSWSWGLDGLGWLAFVLLVLSMLDYVRRGRAATSTRRPFAGSTPIDRADAATASRP